MAKIGAPEPQTASDYEDRTTAAIKSVLVEIGQILGSFRGKFAVVGGAVPWLLLNNAEMPHVGTGDIDLDLHAEALEEDNEYVDLVNALMGHGYVQGDDTRRFQLKRQVPSTDGGPPINVIVDFLMPRDAELTKNIPPILSDFAVQKADGADLALRFYQMVAVEGAMPGGGQNCVEIAVASIPALLAMKGYAINGRDKQKDAYDIYYCIRNYEGGPAALAKECQPILAEEKGRLGYQYIDQKFRHVDDYGPHCVRKFLSNTQISQGRTGEEWQQDAFGQVEAWLKALGIRV